MKRILVIIGMLVVILRLEAQNVGIGTDEPESKLHVAGVVTADALLLNTDTMNRELLRFETGGELIEQNKGGGIYFAGLPGWQSFTATRGGEYLVLNLFFYDPSELTLIKLYEGEGTSGAVLDSQSVAYSQVGWISVKAMHASIDSGNLYTVWMDNMAGIVVGSAYSGGVCSLGPSFDLRFRIYISDELPVSIEGQGPARLVLPGPSSVVDVNGTVRSDRLQIIDRIGIGTDTPDRPLTLKPTTTGTLMMSFQDFSGETQWHWWMPYGTDLRLSSGNSANSVLSILPDGKIGIGVAGPANQLHVLSPLADQMISRFSSSGGWGEIVVDNGTQQVDLGAFADGGYVGTLYSGDFRIRTGSVSRIFLQHSTGHVGIGTTSPTARLYVLDTNASAVRIAAFEGYGAGDRNVLVGNSNKNVSIGVNATNGYIGTYTASDFALQTGNVERLFIDHETGNVGIGTNSPEQKLDVNGNIKIAGVILNESVIAPTLLNNWVNYDAGFETAGYYKDKEGVVHLHGLIKSGTAVHIMTLPEGYRPDGTHLFTVISEGGFARIDVQASGVVTLVGSYSNAYVSLSGISFRP